MDWQKVTDKLPLDKVLWLKVGKLAMMGTLREYPDATHWTTLDVIF